MTIEQYLNKCQVYLKKQEELENYEECQEVLDLINSIKNKDVERYIELAFCIDSLIEDGFFKSDATWQEKEIRICTFFNLKSIFEYSLISVNAIVCTVKTSEQ